MQNYSSTQQTTGKEAASPSKQSTTTTTTTTGYTSPGRWGTTATTATFLDTMNYLSHLPPTGSTGLTTSHLPTDYKNQTSYSSPGHRTSASGSALGSEGKYYDTASNPSISREYTTYTTTTVHRSDYQGAPRTDLTSKIHVDTSPSKISGGFTSEGLQSFSTLATKKSPESSPTTHRTTYSTSSYPQGDLSQSYIKLQSTNSPQGFSTLNLSRTAENTDSSYYPSSSIYNKQASPDMSPRYHSLQKDILDRVQRANDTVDKTLSNSKTQSPSLRTSHHFTVEGLKTSDIATSPTKRAQAEEERIKRSSAPAYNLSSVDKILSDIRSPGLQDQQQLGATNLNQKFTDVVGSDSTQVTTLREENQSLKEEIAQLRASREQEGEKVKRAALPVHSEESQTKLRDLESQVNSLTTERDGLQNKIDQLKNQSVEAEESKRLSEIKHMETTSNYEKLETELRQLEQENEALQGKTAEIDRLNQEINTHRASMANNEQQAKEQSFELEKLQTEVRQLHEAKNLLGQGDLLSEIQNLIQSNNTLKGELDQHLKQHGSSSEALESRIRELEQAKASAEEQVKKLNASLEESNSQLSNSQQGSESQLKTLQDEKSSLLQQIHLLLQESSASTAQNTQVEDINNTELRSLFDHILKTKSDLNQLRESEDARQQEISQLTKANQALNEEIAANKSKSTEAQDSLRTAEQQKNQRIAELEGQIARLQAERSGDQAKISELTNSIKSLENNSDENTKDLVHQVQTLNQQKASLESQISSLQTENKNFTQELTTLRGSSSSQEGQFNEEKLLLQKQITQAEEKLQAAQKETLETKTALANRVAQLESDKAELEKKLNENQGLAFKSQGELNDILSNLKSTKEAADREKQNYEKELAQTKAQLESLKQEIAQLRATHETESRSLKETKTILEQELKKSSERETSTQAGAKAETQKLQESLKKAQDENTKLKQELQNKESNTQKQKQTQNQDDSKKVKDLESRLAKITSEREQEQKKFTDLENESRLKDKQIEGLKYDISQMKGFIYQHHNESLFDQNENAEEQKSDRTSDIKFTVPSETSFTQDLLGSFVAGSEWETGSIKRSQPKANQPKGKAAKASRGDPNDPFRGTEYIISQAATKTQPAKIVTKKQKEQDPVHARYEKIIKELNEKMSNIDKSRKKDAELRILEASKQYIDKEENLTAEIETLKQQNATLVKKIEDIEWNRAYEFADKAKKEGTAPTQNQPPVKSEPAQAVPADTENKKKKKKKKKKTNANEKSKEESDVE